MNIWLVNHYAASPSVGRSTRHYALAKELTLLGHRVAIIAADTHHGIVSSPSNGTGRVIQHEDGVQFIYLRTPNYQSNGLRRIANLLVFTWAVLRLRPSGNIFSPDVIIGSSVHPFAAWAAERLAARLKVPFCFEVRDLWPQTLIDMGALHYYNPVSVALRWLEGYLYRRAQRTIVLLPFAHEYVSRFGIPKSHIAYLPNGVDVSLFPIEPLAQEKEITIMYIGAHGQANALDCLLEAASLLAQRADTLTAPINWRFIGDGTEKKRLQTKAAELGLHDVHFEASIPKQKVPLVMQEADILVLNLMDLDTYKYGISLNKLFEYLAAAKPIVFGCAARNDPVAEAKAGITVPPGNAEALAAGIEEIARLSLDQRQEIGLRGRYYVEENHSFESLGAKLEQLLAGVLKQADMHNKPVGNGGTPEESNIRGLP